MERRKGFGKMMTGKRVPPPPEGVDGQPVVTTPLPVKPMIPKRPAASTSIFLPSSSQTLPPGAQVQEYNVRVPKASTKPHNLMRFNDALNVDFSKWVNVRMQREDNSHLYKLPEFQQMEMPKFGAGSEFGRDEREEARKRKYGFHKRRYKRENQPWILKAGTGDTTRKFKGLREGGVNENASYFIFTQSQDGCFEVFPIKEWYNFTPVQRYKALSAEEAEEQFSKRSKILNLFSVMVQKRIREDKDEGEEPEKGEKTSKGRKANDMQLTDMDDWVVEEMEDDDDSDEDGEENEDKPKKNKKKPGKKDKEKKKDSDDDLDMEDSDDGDEEGREQDYMTDVSSESEDEEEKKPDLPGIDQDDNLRALLESESSEEEDKEVKKEEAEEETENGEGEKKKKSKKKKKGDKKSSALPDAPTLMDETPQEDVKNIDVKNEHGVDVKPKVETSPVAEESGATKRKAPSDSVAAPAPKKVKVDLPPSMLQLAASEGITEDAVKKYLLRKPMTIAELLQKFKPKKSKISSNDMVPIIAHILKNLNPTKRSVSNKTYFFINNKSP